MTFCFLLDSYQLLRDPSLGEMVLVMHFLCQLTNRKQRNRSGKRADAHAVFSDYKEFPSAANKLPSIYLRIENIAHKA